MPQELNTSIILNRLKFHACHGVTNQECTTGATYEVSLRLYYKANLTMKYDSANQATDYDEIIYIVNKIMAAPISNIENAAYKIHLELTNRFPNIKAGELTIHEINPMTTAHPDSLGYIIEW